MGRAESPGWADAGTRQQRPALLEPGAERQLGSPPPQDLGCPHGGRVFLIMGQVSPSLQLLPRVLIKPVSQVQEVSLGEVTDLPTPLITRW